MIPHIRICGVVLALYGFLLGAISTLFVVMMGGLTGLLGFIGVTEDEGALVAAVIYGVLTVFVALFALVPPLGCLVSGLGLALEKGWARIPAMLFGAIAMLNVPLGTLVGLYVIVVMMDKEVAAHLAGEVV